MEIWGKGKGRKSGYNNSYRSPGKGVGGGLDYMTEDCSNARGTDDHHDYHPGDRNHQKGEQHLGYAGSFIMLLERGWGGGKKKYIDKKTTNRDETEIGRRTGEHGPLCNTSRPKPITFYNKHQLLHDDDSDAQTDDETCHGDDCADSEHE